MRRYREEWNGEEEIFSPLDEMALRTLPMRMQKNLRDMHDEKLEKRDRLLKAAQDQEHKRLVELVGRANNVDDRFSLMTEDRSIRDVDPLGMCPVNEEDSEDNEGKEEDECPSLPAQVRKQDQARVRESVVPMAHWQTESRANGISPFRPMDQGMIVTPPSTAEQAIGFWESQQDDSSATESVVPAVSSGNGIVRSILSRFRNPFKRSGKVTTPKVSSRSPEGQQVVSSNHSDDIHGSGNASTLPYGRRPGLSTGPRPKAYNAANQSPLRNGMTYRGQIENYK
ncbi:MAG: hypothetical protein M1829_000133 [Trizodia sp. TS-e1964]|nr:MAG: hypothetical protein M1829_000133 [Trizodia sp. TS-e1964]